MYDLKADGRFATLLADESPRRLLHDQPLYGTPEWVVAPTLGAIVPNWLIAVPRRAALNFYDWHQRTGSNPSDIVAEIAAHLGLTVDSILWFEHGPKAKGTQVGCGVDYAHLHVILNPTFSIEELLQAIKESVHLDWLWLAKEDAYSRITEGVSYLLIGAGDRAAIAERVDEVGSQFLRRIISGLVSQVDLWNYRSHPHHENIATTIATFRALENAARSGV